MNLDLPASWRKKLIDEFEKPYFKKLQEFVDQERDKYEVYPPEGKEGLGKIPLGN